MDTLLSTVDQPLGLRARADLLARAVPVAGTPMWVVKDPITLEQYQLTGEEHSLWSRLRTSASLRDLQRHFAHEFAPAVAEAYEIWSALARLHQSGLLIGVLPGQGEALAQRRAEQRSRERRWAWMKLLAIRLPGINPDPLLEAALPLARPLLCLPGLAIGLLLVLAAAGLLISHAEEFIDRLPTLGLLMSPSNWPYLLLAIVGLKVLHELGHAMVAKRLGAEVPEMGILLLAFLPCLYCDVSDIWRLPKKWQRMAVSAAGMGVELVVASIATFVWWFSEPGLINLLALNVMMVATVGTLAINANPLLRYDGYYLLMDLTETPNMWQRSREALRSLLGRWFFRPTRGEPAPPREPLWLAGYAALSSLYLIVVMLAIFFSLVGLLAPRGLAVVAYLLGGIMLAAMVTGAVLQITASLRSPLKRSRLRPVRMMVAMGVVLVAIVGLMQWPIVDAVVCQATVVPQQAERVVTTLDGRLDYVLPAGTRVARGDVIARLSNQRVAHELATAEGAVATARTRLEGLMALRRLDAEASSRIPAAQTELDELTRQLERHRQEAARLELRAPVAGVLIPPPRTVAKPENATLAAWSGTPLDAKNLGAWIAPGTLMALVDATETCEVMVAIDERDIELVAPGQSVRVQLDQHGGRVFDATVAEIARRGAATEASSPQTMGLAQFLPHPLEPALRISRYEARLAPRAPLSGVTLTGGGRAKIETGRTRLGVWLIRELRDTFRLP